VATLPSKTELHQREIAENILIAIIDELNQQQASVFGR